MARTSEDSDALNEACLIYKRAGTSGDGDEGGVFQGDTRPQGPPLVP